MNNPVQLYRNDDLDQQNIALSGRRLQSADDAVDFTNIFSTLRRRRLLFIIVAATIFLLGLALTFLSTPLYTATATVVMNTTNEQLTPRNEQVMQDASGLATSAVDTEVEVITSNEMANKVAEALKLDTSPLFAAPHVVPPRGLFSFFTGPPTLPARSYDAQAQRDYVVAALEARLKVQRSGTTYALDISFTAPDPNLAAQITNEYAKQYTQSAVDRKRAATASAIEFLTKRLTALRDQANVDTQAVQQYRIAHNLLSTNASQLTEQEVSTYNQQLAAARAAAAEDRSRLATAQSQLRNGSKGDDVGEALNSGVVSSLKTQRATLAAELANLSARYGPRHPDVLRMQQQLADLDASIQTEINRVISNLKAKTNVSGAQLATVEGSLSGARGTLSASNQALVGFEDLTRKAAASQARYQAYLDRYTQITAQEGTESATARTISSAVPPIKPSSPIIVLNLFLAAVLGLGAGIGAAFVTELMFQGLTTGEDVERMLGVPYLGGVPLLKSVAKWKGDPLDFIVERPHSVLTESVRSLVTSINYSIDAVVQVIAVTSALPKEGKSTVAASIARVAALDGQRVVLVDCDLRRRSVNRLAGDTSGPGLIDVLQGEAKIEDVLTQDASSGAWLLPLNSAKVAPGDYFIGDNFRELLSNLRGQFTLIVLDTAPLLPIADTRVIATLADAVVMISRWRKTSEGALRSALRLLPRGRVNLAGVVLSQIDLRRQARFGYGDSTYYYRQYKEYYS